LINYELTINPDYDTKKTHLRLKSLRFDLRLHMYLDTFLKDKTASGLYNDNQAGLFADVDIGSVRAFGRKLIGGGTLRGNSEIAFFAAEKSVVREVNAPGLVRGDSRGRLPGSQDDIVCWDNIHCWGADSPGRPMISTPGAFHAAHIHWRWGELLKSWLARATASWRRFQPGSPLLDPRIPLQTLLLAITKFRRNQDPNHASLADLSKEKWDDLFHNKSNYPQPEKIQKGGDLVLWYSTEIHRHQFQMPPAGTIFLHGMFFAHDGTEPLVAQCHLNDRVTRSHVQAAQRFRNRPEERMVSPRQGLKPKGTAFVDIRRFLVLDLVATEPAGPHLSGMTCGFEKLPFDRREMRL